MGADRGGDVHQRVGLGGREEGPGQVVGVADRGHLVGVGDRTEVHEDGVPGLTKESFSQNKVFAGVNLFLGFNLAFEVDRTGDITSYGFKGGFRF